MYKQLMMDGKVRTDMILRVADQANIPNDMNNRDWVEYQEWLKLGNTPLSA